MPTKTTEPKAISVIPESPEQDAVINEICEANGLSRAALARIAIDFTVTARKQGRADFINGRLVINPKPARKAA